MPVVSAQCIIGNEKYPDVGILLNYDDDDYFQGYHQIKGAFRAFIHDDLLQPFISEDDFRSSTDENGIGYKIHAFDIRCQKNFERAQPVKVEFKFNGVIPGGIHGYALVLTNKFVSLGSDEQRHFDSN